MRRWTFILIPAALLLGGGVGLWVWLGPPAARHFYTDAETIRLPVAQAQPREVLWQPPRPLAEILDTGQECYEPKLSWDGLTLFFVRGKAGHNADIFTSRRTPEGWTEPRALAALNSAADDLGPAPSSDGARLYFYSNREGGQGGYDLWMSQWADEAWQAPVNLGPAVNSPYNDYGPAPAADGERLYFASNRPQPRDARQPNPDAWPATVREDLFYRTYDLYEAVRTPAGFAPAGALPALNTAYNEGAPGFSPAGDFLYFASDRPGGQGGFDLYRARRLNGEFQRPENLGVPVNSVANDLDPGLSALGYALFFSSDRLPAEDAGGREASGGEPAASAAGSDGPPGGELPYHLYHTTAREVFLDSERVARPGFDWAALLRAIWPQLLWLLLALLLLLLLLGLWRDMKKRRLSLLARCLLASVMLHLLALMLSSLWKVGSAVMSFTRGAGAIQVALSPTADSDALALQIHGALSDVTMPAIEAPEMQQREIETSEAIDIARADLAVDSAAVEIAQPRFEPRLDALRNAAAPAPPAPELRTALDESPAPRTPLDVSAPEALAAAAVPEAAPRRARPAEAVAERRAALPEVASAAAPSTEVTAAPADLSAVGDERLASENPPLEARPAIRTEIATAGVQSAATGPLALRLPTPEGARQAADVGETPAPRVEFATNAPPRAELGVMSAPPARPAESFDLSAPAAGATDVAAAPAWRNRDIEAAPPAQARPVLAPPASATPRNEFALRLPEDARDERAAPVSEPEVALAAAMANEAPRAGLVSPEALKTEPVALDVARPAAQPSDLAAALPAPVVQPTPREVRPALPHLTAGVLPHEARSDTPRLALALPQAQPDERPNEAESKQELPRVAAVETAGLLRPSDLAPPPMQAMRAVRVTPTAATPAETTTKPPAALASAREVRPAALDARLTPVARPSTDRLDLSLRLPPAVERQPLTDAYVQRDPARRDDALRDFGGNTRTEDAVAKALAWLARHQSADGRWDGQQFDESCGACGGATANELDVAVTGLTLLAFLAADHTHLDGGPYQQHVRRALDWLLAGQLPDGDLRRGDTMYAQGIATIALCEAYAMTGDETLAEPARRAVQYIIAAQHPRTGGWRFQPGDEGDTSVLGWQVLALRSAAIAGIRVPPQALAGAKRWLMLVEDRSQPGLYAYLPGEPANEAMTAEGLLTQQLIGQPLDDPRTVAAVEALSARPPQWSQGPSTYAWFFSTQALFHNLGEPWKRWNRALRRELTEHQEGNGPAEGSWPPEGDGAVGGRVYQTALCTLMLETYYRYAPLQSREYAGPGIGALEGVARSAETRAPLAGVTIRLDLPGGEPLTATTDDTGRYTLVVPEVPDHFALSAAHPAYVPQSRNVSALELRGRTLRVDFDLMPVNIDVVALEAEPEVHHLGNDRFEGRINSQFQRDSEGDLYIGRFTLSAEQAASRSALLTVMAKGVQCPHEVRLNGELLERRLDRAPDDGSFGEIRFELGRERLRAGENELSIQAVSCRGDLDDFEFVNLVIRLERAGP